MKKADYGGVFPLTPLEKEKREKSLQAAINKLNYLSKEEAIKAIEDVAALVEAFPLEPLNIDKKLITELIKTIIGSIPNTKSKHQKLVFVEMEPARTIYLLRGVKIELTWDKKLVSIEIQPKELSVMTKALSIIGMGSETFSDVALEHDKYLAEAISK